MNNITELPSERQCHKNFYRSIWGDYCCPNKCGNGVTFRSKYEYCPCCQQKFYVKAETIFSGSNLSYRQIYLLIYCWQRKLGIGAIKELSGLSYPAIRRWLSRFRQSLPKTTNRLLGAIEVDESFFGRLRSTCNHLVIGGVSRGNGRLGQGLALAIIPDRGRSSVESFITKRIDRDSLVITDALGSYNELPLLGYEHDFCNHSLGHFGPTNQIESVWSALKRHLRHTYRDLSFPMKELKLILREWECRHNRPELFYNVDNYLTYAGCSRLV
jgi:transposase-like protein